MRVHRFTEPCIPADIPIAGTTLHDLLGEYATPQDVEAALANVRHKPSDVAVQLDDEVRRFRTPGWTWQSMSGLEGLVVLRNGLAVFWVVTRMN